jgi:hypothetical protein
VDVAISLQSATQLIGAETAASIAIDVSKTAYAGTVLLRAAGQAVLINSSTANSFTITTTR